MEKIQYALAKARAERDAKSPKGEVSEPEQGRAQKAASPARPTRVTKRAEAASPDVAEAWKTLPLLTLQPKLMKQGHIVALYGGPEGAGIDMMRTRILQQMRDNGWRRLAITSPTSACGKSTISVNLAMSLQRQLDLRTVLMEMDLRRPTLTKMLGIEEEQSFAGVLNGSRDFAENAVRYGPNLAISANQQPSREPAELLSGAHIPEILADIEATYAPDVMIFDMPPMLVCDDMMAVARHVDCVLLVASAEATTVKEVDICETDLASQTSVMGVILNKCRYMETEKGYGYY